MGAGGEEEDRRKGSKDSDAISFIPGSLLPATQLTQLSPGGPLLKSGPSSSTAVASPASPPTPASPEASQRSELAVGSQASSLPPSPPATRSARAALDMGGDAESPPVSEAGDDDISATFWDLPDDGKVVWPVGFERRCQNLPEVVAVNEDVERHLADAPPMPGWELNELTWQGQWAMLLCLMFRRQVKL